MTRTKWYNWAGNQMCSPEKILSPKTEEELITIVKDAISSNSKVKAVGSGHSFTGTALTDGILLDLSQYREITDIDREKNLVTVQTGKKLEDLNPELWDQGLSMSDLGDIAYQSVGGAMSTGTHGTGLSFGCLATQIVAARVITGEGDILDCSRTKEPDLFRSAIVGVGAAGLLSTVTLQLEDRFNLHAQEIMLPLDEVIAQQDEFAEANEHFEYFCQPGGSMAFTKRNNRTTTPAQPDSAWRRRYEEDLFPHVYRANRVVERYFPKVGAFLSRSMRPSGRENYVDRSYSVFTSERKMKFVEMEYFIPRVHARDALERIFRLVETSGLEITMPIEVRWAKGDDLPLSMCYGRDTVSIAIHVRESEAFEPYFVPVETIMSDYDGRPHWGKMHFQTTDSLSSIYPEWETFQRARRELDPDGIFENNYTRRVLGSIIPG